MSSDKYVIGSGALLAWALASWAEVAPGQSLHGVDVGPDGGESFDLGALAGVVPSDATAFVAWGPQFLNFRRLELMGELKLRGFRLPPLVCRGATVSATATLGENCTVGAGAIVGAQCQLGFNTVVGSGAVIGQGSRIGASAWVDDGVLVGAGAVIGAHATLGCGVRIEAGIQVGKRCIVDVPGRYGTSIDAGTFHLAAFRHPVVILNA